MNNINQELALHDELKMSANLIKQGFGELQEMKFEDNFYYLPHQLLTSGFERVMKCYLVLMNRVKTGEFPSKKILQKYSHDLNILKDKVIKESEIINDNSLLKADYCFVRDDKLLKEILTILSKFGKQGRYHNLNVVTDTIGENISPDKEWETLQSSLIDTLPYDFEQSLELESKTNRIIISKLERFVRFLSRLFVCDINGSDFQTYSATFNVCRGMMDDILGTTDYRRTVKILQKKQDTWNRRSKEQILNGKWPATVITKENFTEEWPFRNNVTEVIVELQEHMFPIININGIDFALLKGVNTSRFNYPDPHEVGIAIVGKSIGTFLKIASSLEGKDE